MRMKVRGDVGNQLSKVKGDSPTPDFVARSVTPKRGRLFLREPNLGIGRRRALLRRVPDTRSDD